MKQGMRAERPARRKPARWAMSKPCRRSAGATRGLRPDTGRPVGGLYLPKGCGLGRGAVCKTDQTRARSALRGWTRGCFISVIHSAFAAPTTHETGGISGRAPGRPKPARVGDVHAAQCRVHRRPLGGPTGLAGVQPERDRARGSLSLQCSGSSGGAPVCTMMSGSPTEPAWASCSVAARTSSSVRCMRKPMPASGWLPSSTTCSG